MPARCAPGTLHRGERRPPTARASRTAGKDEATNPRKVRLANRVSSVVGGALIVAVLAWMLATGRASLAGRLLVLGAGVAAGYALVHLASGRIAPPRTPRGRLAWIAAMALVVCSSFVARVVVGEGPSTLADSTPELLADGFFFGTAFGAVMRLFAPPTEVGGS